jgi:hypothetical protein
MSWCEVETCAMELGFVTNDDGGDGAGQEAEAPVKPAWLEGLLTVAVVTLAQPCSSVSGWWDGIEGRQYYARTKDTKGL